MNKISLDTDIANILARLDRSNSESLLKSIAAELLRLHQAARNAEARIHALETMQAMSDQVAAASNTSVAGSLPTSVAIDAAFSLPVESGFYYLEYDLRGVPYRWTGPDPAFFFEVLIDRLSAAAFRLRYSQMCSPEASHLIRCFVDGQEIRALTNTVDGEFEVAGILPARTAVGATVISFLCPAVVAPSMVGQSNDSRKLGLAFRWLRIEPAAGLQVVEESQDSERVFSADPKPMRPVRSRGRIQSSDVKS